MKNTRATHLMIDFFGCSNMNFTNEQIKSVVMATGCKFVNFIDNKTQFLQLEEGYMALNINEGYNYISIDFYAGGENTNPKLALPLLTRLFKPKQEQIRVLRRGIIS